jgi:hypothetical protein
LGLQPLPSETNFLYFDVGRDGQDVFQALLRHGIIVRHIQDRMIRVTIGLAEENRRFLHALKQVLSSFGKKAQPQEGAHLDVRGADATQTLLRIAQAGCEHRVRSKRHHDYRLKARGH